MNRSPLRVLIADDEPLARQRIADLLERESNVEIVGTAETGPDAIAAIRKLQPDLVFLDVQMPGATGLDVVREIGPEAMPSTIFVTAYDRHALQAFDMAAVDYLVKPFDDERFAQAFHRARRLIDLEQIARLREQLLSLLGPTQTEMQMRPSAGDGATQESSGARKYLDRIAVESHGKITFVPVKQVEFITASGPYAELYTRERMYLIRKPMHELEQELDPAHFIRIHRSIIVRLDLVEALHHAPGGDYEAELRGGRRLRVSRSRREELERRLGISAK